MSVKPFRILFLAACLTWVVIEGGGIDHPSFTQVVIPCNSSIETFQCETDQKCINKLFKCDGITHCSDASDEKSCAKEQCDEDKFFKCDNSECILKAWVCDYQFDCEDKSDEENCQRKSKEANSVNHKCPHGEYQCKDSGLCIPQGWVCDGHLDCHDGNDEKNCSNIQSTPCKDYPCGEFNGTNHCIPTRWLCDGTADCPSGVDEEGCAPHIEKAECSLKHESFLCRDESKCIGFNLLCNGVQDCLDGSDEAVNCTTSCKTKKCNQGCIALPNKKKETCYCRDGYVLGEDLETCYDINECETMGTCSQKCTNFQGGFNCSCVEGYVLQDDKRTCTAKEQYPNPILYFSVKSGYIGGLDLRTKALLDVTMNKSFVRDPIGVSYDILEKRVYWTNIGLGQQSIVSSNVNGSNFKVALNKVINKPEDVAIDAAGRNIYFTESEGKYIGVASINGSHHHKLITKNVDQPRGLALYPAEGLLFYSDWGVTPHISKAGMDGSKAHMIIRNDIKWPNGITVDVVLKRIYWSDAFKDRLESADFEGYERRTILEHVIRHPFSLAVFEDTLYWSDWNGKAIQSCDKFDGGNHETLLTDNKGTPMGIHIFHPLLEPKAKSPLCFGGGEPCSHICVLAYGGKRSVCKCPKGMVLKANNKTCVVEPIPIERSNQNDKILIDTMTLRSTTTFEMTTVTSLSGSDASMSNNQLTDNATVVTTPKPTVVPGQHSKDLPVMPPAKDPVKQKALKDHSNTIGIIVGVCFGVGLFLLVAIIVCICYRRRRGTKVVVGGTGELLHFPNPTFGLPSLVKGAFKDKEGSEELMGVSVVPGGALRKSLDGHQSSSSNRSSGASSMEECLRYNKLVPPSSGRLEFVNCSWSQPKLHAGSITPTGSPNPAVSGLTGEPMRRCVTNPELSKTESNHRATAPTEPIVVADESDESDDSDLGVGFDANGGEWSSDTCKLLN